MFRGCTVPAAQISGWKARAASIRVHSWFKTNPHEAPAAQISGWKAPATSIRAHSWPFVVQNEPARSTGSTDLGLESPSCINSCPFVAIRGSKTNPHEAPAAQISGWKAPAASIRAHSCPFVVQNHPHRAQKKGHFEQSLEMPLCCSLGPAGFEPATKGLCFPLRLSPPFSGSWSGPSLHAACSGRALAVSAVWPLHLPPPKQGSWKSPLFQSRLGSGLAYRLKPARRSDWRRCSVPRI
jgi:hypothetical protein